jgi:PAS domain S-box-containing protein
VPRHEPSKAPLPPGSRGVYLSKSRQETGARAKKRRQEEREKQSVALRYQAVIEMAPDATVVADAEGCIRLVNRQTEMLFGYSREELLGQPIERLIPERFHAAHTGHRAQYAAAPRTRPMGASLELFGRRRDGSEFPVKVSLVPFQEDDELLVIASIRDVDEVQRVQAANQELRRLLAVTDTALAHLELEELLPALLVRVCDVMAVDNAAILLLDVGARELHVRAAQGLEEEVAAGVRIPIGQGFAGRIAASREPLIVDDLSTFPVVSPFLREQLRSAVGVPLVRGERVLGVLHVGTAEAHQFTAADVQLLQRVAERVAAAVERSQLFAAEQEARHAAEATQARAEASAARLRRLIEAGIIGIALGEGESIVDANDSFLSMLGYTRDDLRAGSVPIEPLPPGEGAAYADADARARQELLTQGACTPYERDFLRPDGTHVSALLGAALLSREPLEWVVYALDISERKWLEHEREQAQASELAVREVNQHLDEFFRTAAHDLRQPVTVAKGHADMALHRFRRLAEAVEVRGGKEAQQADRVLESLRLTSESLERLSRLTVELFDIARARTGTLELHLARVDLAALVREQVQAQHAATPARTIRLEVPGDGQSVWVKGDSTRLGQVLTNYLTNALKYSAADKPVTVRLEVVEGLAVVGVSDQGPGLPWEEQSLVWEMLHRAPGVEVQSGSEGSLGMGLYIVKRLIELHPGGRVGVESVVGEGSTFWFRLPAAAPRDTRKDAAS